MSSDIASSKYLRAKGRAKRGLIAIGEAELADKLARCSPRRLCGNAYCQRCRNRMTKALKDRFDDYTITRYGRIKNPPSFRFVTLIFDIVEMNPATVREAVEDSRRIMRTIKRRFPQIWIQGAFDFECINPDDIINGNHTCANNKNLIRELAQGEIFNGEHRICLHAHLLVDLCDVDHNAFIQGCKSILSLHPLQVNAKRLHKNKSLEINLKRLSGYCFKRPIHMKFNYTEAIRRKGDRLSDEMIGRMALLYSSLGGTGYSNLLISKSSPIIAGLDVILNDTTDYPAPSSDNANENYLLKSIT